MSLAEKIVIRQLQKTSPKLNEEQTVQAVEYMRSLGEQPSAVPTLLPVRYEDVPDGRVFYANENANSDDVVFYVHGGSFYSDFSPFHWLFLKKLIRRTDAAVVAFGYRLIPFGTWKNAFDLITPVWRKYAAEQPGKKLILMGDSAGATISACLTAEFKKQGIRLPDELILLSPAGDVLTDNPEAKAAQDNDPWLSLPWINVCGRYWAGDADPHDPRVSPAYADYSGVRNVTVIAGTAEVLLPDMKRFFAALDPAPSNRMLVKEGMPHVYPLMPIPEAIHARREIYKTVKR